jgi:ATP synthase protein I
MAGSRTVCFCKLLTICRAWRKIFTLFVMSKTSPEVPFSMWRFAWDLGYTLALPLVGGVLLGRWLDGRLDTGPWLLVIGLVLGIVVSSFAVVRQLRRALDRIRELGERKGEVIPKV